MTTRRILVIDDDQDLLTMLKAFLERNAFEVDTAFNGKEGLKQLKSQHNLVLCDLKLPDFNGLDILSKIKKLQAHIPVILMTGYSDVRTAVTALRRGAADYVTKPLYPDEILLRINELIEKPIPNSQKKLNKTTKSSSAATNQFGLEYVKGECAAMKSFDNNLNLVAPTDFSVIVLGETGSGKEYVAKRIHELSPRSDKPFIAVDCGALSNDLAASELFGHKKGAFTGAVRDKAGQFELANNGTLFLDEVGNLSYENQIKLLRALEERKITRLGSEKEIPINIRLIVATNDDLNKAIEAGEFREDLFYRMNEFTLNLPSLNRRGSDILLFANHFRAKTNKQLNKDVKGFSKSVEKAFNNYSWPGNLRELKNIVKRAVLLCQNNTIDDSEIPQEIFVNEVHSTDFKHDDLDLKTVVELAEKKAIVHSLHKHHFNKTLVAKALNIDRKTLYNKINAYGIEL